MKDFIQAKTRIELPYLLKYLGLNGDGIEIGVQEGFYSEYILSRSDLKMLYLCDTWKHLDNGYETINNVSDGKWQAYLDNTIKRLSPYNGRYTIIRKTSAETVGDFVDESLDFIYIDADHRYEYVKEDIEKWFPKLKMGGVFSGHDYFDYHKTIFCDGVPVPPEYFGVKNAVDEFFGEDKIFVTKETWTGRSQEQWAPSWYLVK